MNTYMKPFTANDWHTFNGCESEQPYICYVNDFIVVCDGNYIEVHGLPDTYSISVAPEAALGVAEAIVLMLRNNTDAKWVVGALNMWS